MLLHRYILPPDNAKCKQYRRGNGKRLAAFSACGRKTQTTAHKNSRTNRFREGRECEGNPGRVSLTFNHSCFMLRQSAGHKAAPRRLAGGAKGVMRESTGAGRRFTRAHISGLPSAGTAADPATVRAAWTTKQLHAPIICTQRRNCNTFFTIFVDFSKIFQGFSRNRGIGGHYGVEGGQKLLFLRHYTVCMAGSVNVSELARMCRLNRTTEYKAGCWREKLSDYST